MAIVIEVKNSDPCLKSKIRCDALRVIDQFEKLPTAKLLAFFDDEDAPFFRDKFGPMNRGQWVGLEDAGSYAICEWPDYIKKDHLYPCGQGTRAFDHVIYLFGATSTDSAGRVMTFAHELQHFSQFGLNVQLWAENYLLLLSMHLPEYEVPSEHEARIVAKRVARRLCGDEAIDRYLERIIAEASSAAESWTDQARQNAAKCEINNLKFVKNLDCDVPYNLADETASAFRRLSEHREHLQNVLEVLRNRGALFEQVDLQRYCGK
jgi:hypothetical protein